MTALPLRRTEQQNYTDCLREVEERGRSLYAHCVTLGNMISTQQGGGRDHFSIGAAYEGQSLAELPPLTAANYLSTLLMDRIDAFLTPLHVMVEMLRDCMKDGTRPHSELTETVLASIQPEALARHFRGAPSEVAFVPTDKEKSYHWGDMLDTLQAEINKAALPAPISTALREELDSIRYEFSKILAKEHQLQRIVGRLAPPEGLRTR